jgi:phospholipase C
MNQRDHTSRRSAQSSRSLSRRQLLTGAAAAVGLLAAGRLERLVAGAGAVEAATLPNPESTGIEHIVLVTMENRSFPNISPFARGHGFSLREDVANIPMTVVLADH